MNDKLNITNKEKVYVRNSYINTNFEMALNTLGVKVMLAQIVEDRKHLPERHVRSVWLIDK